MKKKHNNKQKIKQDFDSRNKEKKAIRAQSVEHKEERTKKQWTPDAMRETVQNLY